MVFRLGTTHIVSVVVSDTGGVGANTSDCLVMLLPEKEEVFEEAQ